MYDGLTVVTLKASAQTQKAALQLCEPPAALPTPARAVHELPVPDLEAIDDAKFGAAWIPSLRKLLIDRCT